MTRENRKWPEDAIRPAVPGSEGGTWQDLACDGEEEEPPVSGTGIALSLCWTAPVCTWMLLAYICMQNKELR